MWFIANGRRGDAFLRLSEIKIHFDVQGHIDRSAILRTGLESPLLQRLNGAFIEAEAEAAHDALDIEGSVFSNDGFQNNGSLIMGFARLFRIFRFDSKKDSWCDDTAAEGEHAAFVTAARGPHGAFSYSS